MLAFTSGCCRFSILDALDGRGIDLKHTDAADMSGDSYSALGDMAFDAAMNELPATGGTASGYTLTKENQFPSGWCPRVAFPFTRPFHRREFYTYKSQNHTCYARSRHALPVHLPSYRSSPCTQSFSKKIPFTFRSCCSSGCCG
jgi:hypothetical protein